MTKLWRKEMSKSKVEQLRKEKVIIRAPVKTRSHEMFHCYHFLNDLRKGNEMKQICFKNVDIVMHCVISGFANSLGNPRWESDTEFYKVICQQLKKSAFELINFIEKTYRTDGAVPFLPEFPIAITMQEGIPMLLKPRVRLVVNRETLLRKCQTVQGIRKFFRNVKLNGFMLAVSYNALGSCRKQTTAHIIAVNFSESEVDFVIYGIWDSNT